VSQGAGGVPHRLPAVYCRFSGMVIPGSSIKVRLTGKNKTAGETDLFFTVFNAEEKKAISDGYLRLKD
jgi:sensor domain CHASE-containing protein